MSAEHILERAAYLAASGLVNPHLCLIDAERGFEDQDGSRRALLAVMEAAGGSLVQWSARPRSSQDVAALLEEALFNVRLTG